MVAELDDSDADPDYSFLPEDRDSSSDDEVEEGKDEEDRLPLGAEASTKRGKEGPEVRVYMQPAIERADADSDVDSGK